MLRTRTPRTSTTAVVSRCTFRPSDARHFRSPPVRLVGWSYVLGSLLVAPICHNHHYYYPLPSTLHPPQYSSIEQYHCPSLDSSPPPAIRTNQPTMLLSPKSSQSFSPTRPLIATFAASLAGPMSIIDQDHHYSHYRHYRVFLLIEAQYIHRDPSSLSGLIYRVLIHGAPSSHSTCWRRSRHGMSPRAPG